MIKERIHQLLSNRSVFNLLIKKERSYRSGIFFINVDPKRVSHLSLLPENSAALSGKNAISGSFKGGFDMIKIPFKSDFMYQTVKQLLNKESWDATPYCQKLLKNKGYDETLSHYSRLKILIRDIKKEGYLSQYELGRANITSKISQWEVPRHEMVVGMDRWGQIFRIKGGRHRLAIAQHLDVPKIPAVLMLYYHSAIDYLPEDHRVIRGNIEDFRPFEKRKRAEYESN